MHSPEAEARPAPFLRRIFSVFGLRVFPSLASLAVIVLFSRSLEAAEYGLYQNFWVQLYLLSALGTLGLGSLIFNYPTSELRRFFAELPRGFWMGSLALLSLLVLVFLTLQAPYLGRSIPSLFFFIYSLGLWGDHLLCGLRRFGILAGINLVYALLFFLVHLYWLNFGQDLDVLFEYLLLLLCLRLFFLVVAILLGIQKIPLGLETVPSREKISLWVHLGAYELSQLLFRWMDKFLISLFLIQEQAAIYFNGSQGIPFLPLWLGAVAGASLLQMAAHRGSRDHVLEVSLRASRVLASFIFPLWAFLIFYTPTLFDLILSPRYRESIPIFYVGLTLVPLRAYSFTSILQHYHRGRIINLGSLGDLMLALLLAYPLYRGWGLPGIAAAFVISTYWQNGYYILHTARLLNTSVRELIPWKDWGIKASFSLGLMILAWGIDRLWPSGSWPWIGMAASILAAAFFYMREKKSISG